MSEQPEKEGSLAEEFRQLGDNLVKAMQALWESPERKRLENELAKGASELSSTLKREAERLTSGGVAKQVRAGAGEMSLRLREELVSALKAANTSLAEAATRLEKRAGEGQAAAPGSGETTGMSDHPAGDVTTPAGDTGHREIHPDDNDTPGLADTGRQEVHPDDVES